MNCRWYVGAALALSCSWAASQVVVAGADAAPDLRPEQHVEIESALGCSAPASQEAKAGCANLSAFMSASTPDAALLQRETPLDGMRWIGEMIVVGPGPSSEWLAHGEGPRWNAVVFGTRYSSNFHRNIYFGNGVSVKHVWPVSERRSALIRRAGIALHDKQALPVDADALLRFARRTELEFVDFGPSQGRSWIAGSAETFIRQEGQDLLIVQIGPHDATRPTYRISRISLKHGIDAERPAR